MMQANANTAHHQTPQGKNLLQTFCIVFARFCVIFNVLNLMFSSLCMSCGLCICLPTRIPCFLRLQHTLSNPTVASCPTDVSRSILTFPGYRIKRDRPKQRCLVFVCLLVVTGFVVIGLTRKRPPATRLPLGVRLLS